MDFKTYQKKARETAQYPNLGSNNIYPTLGLVGEAGPEAIIPLDRLDGMMRSQKGEFVLRGQDLVVAMERAQDFRSRITG